jgi:hypothetical protein
MEDSKFNLWRACFSFCFIDGFLNEEEELWIETKLDSLAFTQDQLRILIQDLKSPPAIDQLLPLITKPSDRGFLVNHIRQVAHLDKDVSKAEKEKIDSVLKLILSKVDLKELNLAVATDETASYHEDEVYKVHNKHSFVEALIKDLSKKINPGDYKFPKDE